MPRHRRSMAFAGLVCAAAVWLTGCGGQNAAPGSSSAQGTVVPAGGAADGLVITFDTEPNPPAKGANAFRVRVTRPDGSPPASRSMCSSTTAPPWRSTSSSAILVGLSPTLWISTSEPCGDQPAYMWNRKTRTWLENFSPYDD